MFSSWLNDSFWFFTININLIGRRGIRQEKDRERERERYWLCWKKTLLSLFFLSSSPWSFFFSYYFRGWDVDVCVTMMDVGAPASAASFFFFFSPSNIGKYIKHQTVDNNKEEDHLFWEHFLSWGQFLLLSALLICFWSLAAAAGVLLIYAFGCVDVFLFGFRISALLSPLIIVTMISSGSWGGGLFCSY